MNNVKMAWSKLLKRMNGEVVDMRTCTCARCGAELQIPRSTALGDWNSTNQGWNYYMVTWGEFLFICPNCPAPTATGAVTAYTQPHPFQAFEWVNKYVNMSGQRFQTYEL